MKRILAVIIAVITLSLNSMSAWALFDLSNVSSSNESFVPYYEFQLAQNNLSTTASKPVAQIITTATNKIFKTKFTNVHYKDDQDLDDFIWRLGGQRLEIVTDLELASHRIDRLVNRVQMILDMWPKDFHIDIHLHCEKLEKNKVAFYDYESKSIHVFVDYATDGVIAHEMAHASIDQHFVTPPPSKMQEILAQYVDRHLWSDY